MDSITEGKATISAEKTLPTRKQEVFYNPLMESNRTISLLLLKALGRKNLRIALPLAGTGVRGIRMALELPSEMVASIAMNDFKKEAYDHMQKNIERNAIPSSIDIKATQQRSDAFFLSGAYDYIDIDPFGSPSPYLDAAVKRLRHNGILAVTATDTGALAGTYPYTCMRRYWAKPIHNEQKHEFGLRILIRKCQLIAAQYDKSLMPLFSYVKDHYYRIFFVCSTSREKVKDILKQHEIVHDAGPFWTGHLFDAKLAAKMVKMNTYASQQNFLELLACEAALDQVGFYDLHVIAKQMRRDAFSLKKVMDIMQKKKIKATRTHFCLHGCKALIAKDAFFRLLENSKL
jgi:tRNA (guanine26-N2/guanine27-N2)-dimethyltransferase